MLSIIWQLGGEEVKRLGHWSSKAFEVYQRLIADNPSAGDLPGVPASIVARSLPFDAQRSFADMLKNTEAKLAFERVYHAEIAKTLPTTLAAQVFVDSMESQGVFRDESFRMGEKTIGRTDIDTSDESGTSVDCTGLRDHLAREDAAIRRATPLRSPADYGPNASKSIEEIERHEPWHDETFMEVAHQERVIANLAVRLEQQQAKREEEHRQRAAQYDIENPTEEYVEEMESRLDELMIYSHTQRQSYCQTVDAQRRGDPGSLRNLRTLDSAEIISLAQYIYNLDSGSPCASAGPSGGPATLEEFEVYLQRYGLDVDGRDSFEARCNLYLRKYAEIAHLGSEEAWHLKEDQSEYFWRVESMRRQAFKTRIPSDDEQLAALHGLARRFGVGR